MCVWETRWKTSQGWRHDRIPTSWGPYHVNDVMCVHILHQEYTLDVINLIIIIIKIIIQFKPFDWTDCNIFIQYFSSLMSLFVCDGVNHLYFQIGNVVVGEIKLMYAEIVSFIMHGGIAMMVDAFSETFLVWPTYCILYLLHIIWYHCVFRRACEVFSDCVRSCSGCTWCADKWHTFWWCIRLNNICYKLRSGKSSICLPLCWVMSTSYQWISYFLVFIW